MRCIHSIFFRSSRHPGGRVVCRRDSLAEETVLCIHSIFFRSSRHQEFTRHRVQASLVEGLAVEETGWPKKRYCAYTVSSSEVHATQSSRHPGARVVCRRDSWTKKRYCVYTVSLSVRKGALSARRRALKLDHRREGCLNWCAMPWRLAEIPHAAGCVADRDRPLKVGRARSLRYQS